MATFRKKFFWWWSWNSDKFEAYLEDMSRQGWVVESTSVAHTVITFKKSEPQNMRYCVDYQNKYTDDYFTIIEDDGWSLVAKGVGWTIWAKAYEEHRPAIFTDAQSMIDRNKRLLKFLGILTLFQIPGFVNLFADFAHDSARRSPFLYILYIGAISFFAFCLYQIYQHNKRLREEFER